MAKKGFNLFAVMMVVGGILGQLPIHAKTWNVRSKMTRAEIQGVFDSAQDGDRIFFHKGIYDFSDGPIQIPGGEDRGAIEIYNKSIHIKGLPGNLIKGIPSVMQNGIGVEGINAFIARNDARDKSITIEDLNIQTFLNPVVINGYQSVTVKGCKFTDAHRNGLVQIDAGQEIVLENNLIECYRIPLYIANKNTYIKPDHHISINDNTIIGLGDYQAHLGIYLYSVNRLDVHNNTLIGHKNALAGLYIRWSIPREGEAPRSFITNNDISQYNYGINVAAVHQFEIRANHVWDISGIGAAGIGVYANLDGQCTYNRIVDNVIEMTASPIFDIYDVSTGLATKCSYNYFGRNTITGTANSAVFVYKMPDCPGHHNVFECNNVSGLTIDPTHYYHYLFWWETYENRFSESWTNNVQVLNYGYSSNEITTMVCD